MCPCRKERGGGQRLSAAPLPAAPRFASRVRAGRLPLSSSQERERGHTHRLPHFPGRAFGSSPGSGERKPAGRPGALPGLRGLAGAAGAGSVQLGAPPSAGCVLTRLLAAQKPANSGPPNRFPYIGNRRIPGGRRDQAASNLVNPALAGSAPRPGPGPGTKGFGRFNEDPLYPAGCQLGLSGVTVSQQLTCDGPSGGHP